MTGAEKFAELLARVQFTYRDTPIEWRDGAILNALPSGVVGLAAELLQQHDYGGAHDVIMLGFEAQMKLAESVLKHMDDEARVQFEYEMRRFCGQDVPVPGSEPAEQPAAPDGNALSDEELRALGLEVAPEVDIIPPPRWDGP